MIYLTPSICDDLFVGKYSIEEEKQPAEDGRHRSCLDQKGPKSDSREAGENFNYNKTQDSWCNMFGEVKLGKADYKVVLETLHMSNILDRRAFWSLMPCQNFFKMTNSFAFSWRLYRWNFASLINPELIYVE